MVGKKKLKMAKSSKTAQLKKKKKQPAGGPETRAKGGLSADQRRAKKLEKRRQEKNALTAEMWAAPVPAHLVARLDVPKITTKHKTYFEIADNHEKKKKLEYTVTNDRNPPPGFTFIPVGDPELTKECKELSRAREAMIFIVSDSKEEHSKIAEHVHRAGYHFREIIVEDAREKLGDRVISKVLVPPGFIEPIPATQEEMNKQAEAALIDLFPRIPNTDREMILRHAFKKGGTFQGEPTVGNQADIPLSRRVQLAALAHIRHEHTRYDLLLRETTWINARKVVEPVCLDILLKWRGDEETGRDQMDEILREVVVITDSEGEEESSDAEDCEDDEEEGDSSDEDGEVTSSSSVEGSVEIVSTSEPRARPAQRHTDGVPSHTGLQAPGSRVKPVLANGPDYGLREKTQKGFKRYQAAFDEAMYRQKNPGMASQQPHRRIPSTDMMNGRHPPSANPVIHNSQSHINGAMHFPEHTSNETRASRPLSEQYYPSSRPSSTNMLRRDEVNMRPFTDHPPYSQPPIPYLHTSSTIPPQVVRGSPTKHGLQDLLVPSIEPDSGNFLSSSRVIERLGFDERHAPSSRMVDHRGVGSERQSDYYSRPEEGRRRVSPEGRQVIIIDDDSPHAKRRRVVHDDPGHFRSVPSHSIPYTRLERLGSPRMPVAVQPGEVYASRGRVQAQPAQGFVQTPGGEQLPVYDAPESGSFAVHPRQLGVQEVEYRAPSGYAGGRYGEPAQMDIRNGNHAREREPFTEPNRARVADPYYGADYRANGPPRHPIPQQPAVDQEFVQSFSQSHLGGNPPSYSSQPQQQRYVDQPYAKHVPQQRYDASLQSYAPPPPVHQGPPAQHMERPTQYTNGPPQYQQQPYHSQAPVPVSYNGHPPTGYESQRQQPPHNGGAPTYVRTVDPSRRNVIILD